MRNTMKVVRWEIKRNLKSKSFVIGLFLTPAIIALFMILPLLFNSEDDEQDNLHLFIKDEVGVVETLEDQMDQYEWAQLTIEETDLSKDEALKRKPDDAEIAYIEVSSKAVENGRVPIYVNGEMDDPSKQQLSVLEEALQIIQIENLDLSAEEMDMIIQGITLEMTNVNDVVSDQNALTSSKESLERIVPGIFAGIILLSIVYTGMMTFQSASQERKDKMAEIILSSLTPNELMQGKIFGYFVLGLIQVFVWMILISPLVIWKFEWSILTYLITPETFVLVIIAVLGYLLFATIFVALGATMEDVSASGNFQGMVFMLPFLPVILIGRILEDPSGIVAQVASYIPFTSPAVLIFRLTLLEEWPWIEIVISIVILLVSVWVFMKLAGKIFKIAIQKYGKNATPKEIWKWMWT